jgi:Uma2 family endonuclease
MIAEPYRSLMSVEEYLELDRYSQEARYEYIDGIVTMMAGGTANHSRISVNIVSQLHMALQDSPCIVYNSDMRVSISPTRYVYPDISVSCDPHDQEDGTTDIVQYPRVIIEVLSPATEAYDRTKKFTYYRDCPAIQEIVFVSTQEVAVDLYRRATDKLWALHLYRSGDQVELKSINVRIPIAMLYARVELA